MTILPLFFACNDIEKQDTGEEVPEQSIQDNSAPTSPENALSFERDIVPLFLESSCINCHLETITTYEIFQNTVRWSKIEIC